MGAPTAEDLAFLQQMGGGLVDTGIPDSNPAYRGKDFQVSVQIASALQKANEDYKAIYGHNLPLASAYRDPDRNRAAKGSPTSDHLHGNAIDIDRAALKQAAPFLEAHGFKPLGGTYHGRSEDNHFYLPGVSAQGGHVQPHGTPPAQAALPAASSFSLPSYDPNNPNQAQQLFGPGGSMDFGPVPDFAAQRQQDLAANHPSIPQINVPAPDLGAIQRDSAAFGQSAVPISMPAPPSPSVFTTNPIEGAGRVVGDIAHGVGDAAQAAWQTLTHPGELAQSVGSAIQQSAEMPRSANPLDVAGAYYNTLGGIGAGALNAGAGLLRGINHLPADLANSYVGADAYQPAIPDIPTGALEQYLADKPIGRFIGENAPFFALEGVNALRGAKAAEEAGALARISKGAGIGAGYGAITGDGGIRGRAQAATELGAIGGGLGALGEGAGYALDRLAPKQAGLTPREFARLDRQTQPDTLNTRPPVGELAPPRETPKSAADSAEVFKNGLGNLDAAAKTVEEARIARQTIEADLMQRTGHADPIEAQRAVGAQINDLAAKVDQGRPLSPEEGASLVENQNLIKRLMDARQQEVQASELLMQERQSNPIQDLGVPTNERPTEQPGRGPVETPAPVDLAGTKPADLAHAGGPEPTQLLGPAVRPLPESARLEAPAAESNQGVIQTPKGAEVFSHGLLPEQLQRLTQKAEAEVSRQKGDFISQAEAERLIARTKRDPSHLKTFAEAGRNGQSYDMSYTPLSAGRLTTENREVVPFSFYQKTIQPQTEWTNLKRQFPTPNGKTNYLDLRDHLVQRLRAYGQDAAQNINANPRDTRKLFDQLIQASKGDELTHVYLLAHNTGETSLGQGAGTVRSYRLDTIQRSSLTGKAGVIPEGSPYQNEIAARYQAMEAMADDPTLAPEVKQAVTKLLKQRDITGKDLETMRKYLEDPQVLRKFCNLLGFV